MIFSSYEFVFLFLPVVLIVYYIFLNLHQCYLSKIWLITASLFFYAWFNPSYLFIFLASIFVNYSLGKALGSDGNNPLKQKCILICGILFNIGMLGYYKYYDFFISNINSVLKVNWELKHLLLPLGISFFTFQQLSYLIDAYKGNSGNYKLYDYALFVSFFPQLIAGPIVLHSEVMPQFKDRERLKLNWDNINKGIYAFAIGLFKKLVLADTFAVWATGGFEDLQVLTFFQGWVISLSYTLQIYFDFSGYCDMAIGLGKMFNIDIPLNFNSPYKSRNIVEFWRRWHITLGKALSTYIYIPLGGNRKGNIRKYINLMATFLISGLWHGAAWTFVVWGALHGLANVFNHMWMDAGKKMASLPASILTFLFINTSWVLFRANSFNQAFKVIKAMYIPKGIDISSIAELANSNIHISSNLIKTFVILISITLCLIIVMKKRNTFELLADFHPESMQLGVTVLMIVLSVLCMGRVSPFIYYNF